MALADAGLLHACGPAWVRLIRSGWRLSASRPMAPEKMPAINGPNSFLPIESTTIAATRMAMLHMRRPPYFSMGEAGGGSVSIGTAEWRDQRRVADATCGIADTVHWIPFLIL